MKNIFITASIMALAQISIKPQVPDPTSFFPSSVGNVWQYDTNFGFLSREIINDSLLEDKSRYIFFNTLQDPAFRLDTLNQVFYDPLILNWLTYKLDAVKGESWIVQPEDTASGSNRQDGRVDSIYETFLFGEVRIVKKIGYYDLQFGDTVINNGNGLGWEYLVSGIGEYLSWDAHEGPTKLLRGCIVDGDTFGFVSSIDNISYNLPETFVLRQNYPNPFNPITIIEFELPREGEVNIGIYNILGQQVDILYDGLKPAGNHKIQWNASGFASGIYIYRLQSDNFVSSKKMLLLK